MFLSRLTAVLGLSLLVHGAAAQTSRSLSVAAIPVHLEGEKLGRDQLFARVDSLESLYESATDHQRADYAFRLGQLYLATGMFKHRRRGLDLLDESMQLDPDSFEAGRIWAATARRMRYAREAQKKLEGMTERFASDPRSHLVLARFHFLEGRRRMLRPRFELARRSYQRCVDTDSTMGAGWYGLAASGLALQDYPGVRQAVQRLRRLQGDSSRLDLLEGAALAAMDSTVAARRLFDRGLAGAETPLREVFEDADGFLDEKNLQEIAKHQIDGDLLEAAMARADKNWRQGDRIKVTKALEDSTLRRMALDLYWRERNPRPTHVENARRLLYWQRLVEADVLFGDPDAHRYGFDTEMGQALVRWGRPTSTYYEAGGWGSILDELNVAGVRLPVGESLPSRTPLWIWTYRHPGTWFSLLFTDDTRNAHWKAGPQSSYQMAVLSRQEPLAFFDRPDTPPPFTVALSTAVFHRRSGEPVLETAVGIRPRPEFLRLLTRPGRDEPAPAEASSTAPSVFETIADSDTLATVEWAIYDDPSRRLDYRKELLFDRNRRGRLHRALGMGTGVGDLDPLVLPIGAILRPGRYRLAVEATGPRGVGHLSRVMEVEVGPDPPAFELQMSDLQLVSAFVPYEPGMSIPLRYVKYGYALVPVPDHRYPSTAKTLSIYFELYNLAIDPSGQTRFDVSYEVFSSSREIRNITLTGQFEREDLRRVEPLSLTFVHEQTGVAREGYVVKGTAVDIAALAPGDYVLVITVHDQLTDLRTSRAVAFRKRGSS